jgi:hypothetical protein
MYLAWSGGKAGRYTPNTQMSNYRSDMDRRSSDPPESILVVDLRDPPSTTQLTEYVSWRDTWTLLVPCQVLSVEPEPLDEWTHGK